MTVLYERIRQRRQELNISQDELAQRLGYKSRSSINKIEKGENDIPQSKIVKFASALNTTPEYLMGWQEKCVAPTATPSTPAVKIKVLGTVAAGLPMYAAENIIDEEEISAEMARDGEYFGLLIKGQSMEPKLYEGDVVIVRKQDFIENGETAIILINGDEATCKLVKEMPDGIMLIGHNTAVYEPHFYSRQEIEKLPVNVIGKVVELRRKF